MADPVTYDVQGRVATIRLDRPDAMNSLDTATKDGLLSALQQAASDSDVRCVVLTGSGRAFSVGQDLREHIENITTKTLEEVWSTVDVHYGPIALAITTMDKPVIAAVNGVAAGAGLSIVLACDLWIAARLCRLQHRLHRRRPVMRHRVVLDIAATHGADEGDGAPADAPHDRGRGGMGAGLLDPVVPADELPVSRPRCPQRWPPGRRSRTRLSRSRSHTQRATPSRKPSRSRASRWPAPAGPRTIATRWHPSCPRRGPRSKDDDMSGRTPTLTTAASPSPLIGWSLLAPRRGCADRAFRRAPGPGGAVSVRCGGRCRASPRAASDARARVAARPDRRTARSAADDHRDRRDGRPPSPFEGVEPRSRNGTGGSPTARWPVWSATTVGTGGSSGAEHRNDARRAVPVAVRVRRWPTRARS